MMAAVTQDLRFALRLLARNPGFTLAAVGILALAIGTTTPTFGIVEAYLLRPLPFSEPERLVHVWSTDARMGWDTVRVSVPDFLDWRRESRSFSGLGAFNYTGETLTAGDVPEVIPAGRVSANLFDVLGRQPALGRTFRGGEDQPGALDVAVLSDLFWRTRYHADPNVLGRTLEIDGRPYSIVGVMPADFAFPLPITRLWIPRTLDPARFPREQQLVQVVGRLAPGVTRTAAQAELTALAARLARLHPGTNRDRGVNVADLRRALNFADAIFRVMAVVLFAAHALVLLIACANISALQLARSLTREREIAIRAALGASRARLSLQLLIESGVLALLGGAIGAGLAWALMRVIAGIIPDELYRVGALSLDASGLLFTLGVSLLAALVAGLLPALRVSRVELAFAFRSAGAATGASRHSLRLQGRFVVGQVGLAVMLLIATALMLRTFRSVRDVDPGFDPKGVLTLQLKPSREAYPTRERMAAFHRGIIDATSAVPGVIAAATVDFLPLNHETEPVEVQLPGAPPGATAQGATLLYVSPRYFELMRVPVLAGRVFEDTDDLTHPLVAVVNEAFAHRYFPGRDAVGESFRLKDLDSPMTIVGVTATTRQFDLVEPPTPRVFLSLFQRPERYLRLLARVEGDPLARAVDVRRAVAGVDPKLPVTQVRSMEQVVQEFLLPRASLSFSLATLGTGALALAALGVYGLMLFFVNLRTREIGIRLALGATPGGVQRLVLRRGLRLAGLGIAIGLGGALVIARLLSGMLYGIASLDPVSFGLVPLLLVLTALLAAWLPARRAARLAPFVALRTE
jgi:putative ABC transport system permease protein